MRHTQLFARRATESQQQTKRSIPKQLQATAPRLQQLQQCADASPMVQAAQRLQRNADVRVTQFGRKKGRKGKPKAKKMTLAEFKELAGPADRRQEYDKLAPKGTIDPRLLRFSQSGCSFWFREAFTDKEGTKISNIYEATAALQDGRLDTTSTPRITITYYQGEIVSVDNRRLKAHKDAEVFIKYKKADYDNLSENQKSHFDGKTHDNLNVR